MYLIARTIPILVLLLSTTACGACITTVFQSSFSSTFSLAELVKRNQANSGLNCSAGGGGGDSSGIGTVAGGIGGKQSSYQKGEGFSCQISDEEQFDEARFIQALKESLEKDLQTNDAEITSSKNTHATSFSIEYVAGNTNGKVDISGTRVGNIYSFEATLAERSDR